MGRVLIEQCFISWMKSTAMQSNTYHTAEMVQWISGERRGRYSKM